jgi:nucleoid-associated protein YejK
MEISNYKSILFGGKMWCSVFGHEYEISKDVTAHFKEYTCKYCQHQLTNTANGKIVFLTEELKAINETLSDFYKKRHQIG